MNASQTDWDAGDGQSHTSALMIIHHNLRGKYIFTAVLALVIGISGGVLGYMSRQPQYESVGQIRIRPSLDRVLFQTEQSIATQMFASFVSSQAEMIRQGRVIDIALDSEEWRAVQGLTHIDSSFDVKKRLKVKSSRNAQEIIVVSFSDKNPDVSAAIVGAVMEAYLEVFGKEGSIANPEVVRILKERRSDLSGDLKSMDDFIQSKAEIYRTENLQPLIDNALYSIQTLEKQREVYTDQLGAYTRFQDTKSSGENGPLTAEQAAGNDSMIAEMLTRGVELKEAKEDMMVSEGLREGHRDVQRLTSMITNNQLRIERRLEELQNVEVVSVLYVDGFQIPAKETLTILIGVVDQKLIVAKARSDELYTASVELDLLRTQRNGIQRSLAEVEQRLDQIETESQVGNTQISGKINIAHKPKPERHPTSDPRKKMAAVGFLGAGAMPVMAILALGYFSHRIQYSDDGVLSGAGSGIIGMLPDLGNTLTDNDVASASAFAVHQIRSQLQIKNKTGESMVYGVTSPAPQDGKTSLIIAMGLSFAESGERTLLVDLDFIGRGLSVHFGYPDAPSLAEVLDSPEEIDTHICDTEFDGLSVLPAGFGDDERVSRLSPRVVSMFINHLREEFDTILIDTGPILGSVEAAFVSPQADGIILVVGRGQFKPLVKKAINQILAVDGKIVATVFNRALIQELRQSSSSMSVHFSRQVSRQKDAISRKQNLWGGPVAGALFQSKKKSSESPIVKSMKP